MTEFPKVPIQIELAHPHDLLARYFLLDKELMVSMLEHYDDTGFVSLLDLMVLRCESPVTIDYNLQELIGDLRFSARFKNGIYSQVFLFFEHQSKKIRLYSLHCLRKILDFYEEWAADPKNAITENGKFPYPLVVILYHGNISWSELLQIKHLIAVPQGVDTNVLWFPAIMIDLSKIRYEELQGHPALIGLFDTLQSYSEGKLQENLGRIVGHFDEVKTDPRAMGWLTSIAHYTLATTKISKDVIVREFSKILDKKETENMILSTMEELYTNGKLEGKLEGEIEGETRKSIQSVLKLLNKRFDKIPESISKVVNSYKDLTALDLLFDRACECKTLAEFEQNLVHH
ncbi:MAG: Rpn family recombination-promoting nuclease/putative transposase [Planctomycetaceae bacterium]|jgi:hypothetical protein|nr:Rpn family recombination-promoting nuclease/putative transposase [Planctomycetaceae bacterium]